jgi:hypothetical protein
MTLQLNIMINVEPRHGVAHDIFNMQINNIRRAGNVLSQEIAKKKRLLN